MRVLEELLVKILEQLKIANQMKELELKFGLANINLRCTAIDEAMKVKK